MSTFENQPERDRRAPPARRIDEGLRGGFDRRESRARTLGNRPTERSAELERAGGAAPIPFRGEMEQAFGVDFSGVQGFTGRADTLAPLNAKAVAVGEHVAFADASPDRATVAHELAHVVQTRQAGAGEAQARSSTGFVSASEPAEVEAERVGDRVAAGLPAGPVRAAPGEGLHRTKMSDIENIEEMRSNRGNVTLGADPRAQKRNTVAPDTALPWTRDGWNAQTILRRLGQHDRLSATDSDGTRCAQAVALASHILSGPAATASFLDRVVAAARKAHAKGVDNQYRVKACEAVLGRVKAAINTRKATYDDLSWAQEAMHDILFKDTEGTDSKDIGTQVVPEGDDKMFEAKSIDCSNAGELMSHAKGLKDNEQLVFHTRRITFNAAFDESDTPNATSMSVGGGRSIGRVDTKQKPNPSAIDLRRDREHGHQLLLVKRGSRLFLYEPEMTKSGRHLLEASASTLRSYIKDQPEMSIYYYMHVDGIVRRKPEGFLDPNQC